MHQPVLIRHIRRALPVALLAIACARPELDEAEAAQAKLDTSECNVSRIADGDSLVCGSTGRVRLLLIDAPELAQGVAGQQAKSALAALLPVGTRARIETDVRPRDDYDRVLGYVYLPDGRMVNEEMARSGYATTLVYPPNVKHVARIRGAVTEAQKSKRGLWATDFFDCSPRDYRARKCGGVMPPATRPLRPQSPPKS